MQKSSEWGWRFVGGPPIRDPDRDTLHNQLSDSTSEGSEDGEELRKQNSAHRATNDEGKGRSTVWADSGKGMKDVRVSLQFQVFKLRTSRQDIENVRRE